MMNEEQAATAIYGCVQSVKNAIGKEKAVGMIMGCIIGEVMLSGGSKEELVKLVDDSWTQFKAAQEAAKGG